MATTPAYKPGQTLENYLAAQKAAFVPQHMEATSERIGGDENRIEVTPAQGAYDTTYNSGQGYQDWYKAQNKTMPVPKGWSSGSLGTLHDFNETANAYTDTEQYIPGTDPSTGKNMAYREIGRDSMGGPTYEIQEYGPNGLVGKPTTQYFGLGTDPVFGALTQIGSAAMLGPTGIGLGGQLGTVLGPALGIGANAATALGTGLASAGKTAAMGGDFGDVAKAGTLGGASSYLGSALNNVIPSDVTGTGINSLNAAATGAIKGVTTGGLSALLQGKNVGDALVTGGLGGGLSGGVSSAVGGTLKDMGIPDSVVKILGPTAVATLLNKDPTGVALNAAIGQLIGNISKPPGKASGGSIEGNDMYTKHFDDGEYVVGDYGSTIQLQPNLGGLAYSGGDYDIFSNPRTTFNPLADSQATDTSGVKTLSDYNAAKDSAALNDSGIAKAPGSVDLGTLGGTQSTGGLNLDLGSLLSKYGLPALLAGLAARDRQKTTGGGYGRAYQSPAPLTRTMSQGKYGPIAKYAADGGMIDGYAQGGGIAAMAKGRFLRGPGDGVSDSIPATIDGNQPAALADGEFVIPARVVSELGNGSSEAGARKLHEMMIRIQKDRRGTKDIAANTKVDRHLPA